MSWEHGSGTVMGTGQCMRTSFDNRLNLELDVKRERERERERKVTEYLN